MRWAFNTCFDKTLKILKFVEWDVKEYFESPNIMDCDIGNYEVKQVYQKSTFDKTKFHFNVILQHFYSRFIEGETTNYQVELFEMDKFFLGNLNFNLVECKANANLDNLEFYKMFKRVPTNKKCTSCNDYLLLLQLLRSYNTGKKRW